MMVDFALHVSEKQIVKNPIWHLILICTVSKIYYALLTKNRKQYIFEKYLNLSQQ